jgi:hypothetical protein
MEPRRTDELARGDGGCAAASNPITMSFEISAAAASC